VQVKTNGKPAGFWLVGKHARTLKSDSHVYVFVNLRGSERPEYVVASSVHVASKVCEEPNKKSAAIFYAFYRKDKPTYDEGWQATIEAEAAVEETAPKLDERSN
jgi:hypothetical protein